ncbi:LamG-like jellyroll fold domain-containing protein [Nonomuraea sediminis]|uniref:LamG-like jellyroll fold domain-containing protein n=1 Tax=Nonomuraea sediminis TaxID=2835864 RepID=UPI001BDD08A5|nr:LamG-like jellyroll fold domain-containing protein [Nonomuraea sediminis]
MGDFSGNNNTGTALDTTWTTGKYGSALSFNGSSSWVTIQHAASLRLTNALTLSAWVRPATADALWRAVLMKERSTGGGYGLYASSEYNAPAGWLETNQQGGGLTGDDPLPANQWSHLATTYDGSTLRLYINGALAAQAPIAGDVLDDGGPLRIGGNSVWGEYFSGLIDEVRIYNRAQTAAEIQTDMNTPIGTAAAPRAVAQTSRTDAPTIEKLTADSGSLTPRLTAWIPGQRRDKTKIEIEVSNRPTKTINSTKITERPAKDDLLIWSGQVTARPDDSRVTLQVPKDRLSKGANVRWRARITGGSWTDWQDLSITADARALTTATTAAYPQPTADEIKRTLRAGPQGVVPTPSYNDCRTKTQWDAGPYTYTMNRFNVCQVSGFIVEYWKEWWKGSRPFGKKLGTLRGHQLTYLDGKLNRREFYVRKHFYIDKVENVDASKYDLGDAYIAFASTMGSKSSDCTRVSPASGTTVYKTVNAWKQDTATEWHSSELFTAGPGNGYHKISNCTINHSILSKSPVDFEESSTKIYALGTFRCDTSPMVKYHTGGGCVSSDAVPAFTISMNDVSSTGVPYKSIHQHIKKALTHPEDTVPKPGGPTFPDLTGTKSIPGGSEIKPLHRHGYEPIQNGNRSAAKTVCDLELGDRDEKMHCDEFPFASTLEGAARANPFYNFSVAWINGSVNTSHGTYLNAWYSNNRMLNSDPFWIQPLD